MPGEDVPGEVTFFLNRASIDDLLLARDREISKPPMTVRWWFVQMIDAELHGRKAGKLMATQRMALRKELEEAIGFQDGDTYDHAKFAEAVARVKAAFGN